MMDQVERLLLVASGAELSTADVTAHACGNDPKPMLLRFQLDN